MIPKRKLMDQSSDGQPTLAQGHGSVDNTHTNRTRTMGVPSSGTFHGFIQPKTRQSHILPNKSVSHFQSSESDTGYQYHTAPQTQHRRTYTPLFQFFQNPVGLNYLPNNHNVPGDSDHGDDNQRTPDYEEQEEELPGSHGPHKPVSGPMDQGNDEHSDTDSIC